MQDSHVPAESESEVIAIVGIGCRYPGKIDSPQTFWKFLTNSGDAIGEVPPSRFDIETYYDPRPATPGKVMTRWGGFLDGIDQFDADFFGMSPREADRLDPQQRLLLEVAWEALEDAGEVQNTSAMLNGGVFVGVWLNDYEGRLFRDPDQIDFYMTTGSGRYPLSGRLSYFFGMQGPSLTVDTACSSSLVAVHQACQNLLTHQCDLALAGGANIILQPSISIAYSQSRMMAPDGKCKFGDARGDGYVRSEGAALVALKRLSDALADGNPIYAVIRGSAVNNDGRSSGFLTTPGGAGQEDMLRKAYRNARVSPGQVQYVEAHGTGTRAGDPVEIQALGAVLKEGRPAGSICKVGSVKTNFGHTEGAAGIAALIKVALSLKHQYLPASLHYQSPNPAVPWEDIPIRIASEAGPWPEHTGPAIAGVSAFGISGTNAHLVLQEPPRSDPQERPAQDPAPAHMLPISARSPKALRAMAQAYLDMVKETDAPALPDLCYTAAVRRNHHLTRAAFVAQTNEDLAGQLALFLEEQAADAEVVEEETPRKILFIFPGQGSQWAGMSRQLMQTQPAFRAALEQCSQAIQAYTGWSLIEILNGPEIKERLEQIDFIQPALFAMQAALAAQWRAWGVEPDAIVGHSMGEVAAAYIAGAISLDDAARVICYRSQLMKTVSGKGAMAVVSLTIAQAQAALVGFEDRLSIAVSNSAQSTVISGDADALDELTATLQSQNILTRRVKVDVAAHSPHMEPLRPQLEAALAGLEPGPASVPIFSTVTGQVQDGLSFDIAYWGSNLRQPVLFSSVIQKAMEQGYNTFIELSPHPVLLAAVEQSFPTGEEGQRYVALPSLRRDEDEHASILQSLGKLYQKGYAPDWKRIYPAGGQVVSLPTYAWQREHFWLEIEPPAGSRKALKPGTHRLTGYPVETAAAQCSIIRQIRIDQKTFPELYAHRLHASTLLGASAFIELARAASKDLIDGPLVLEDVHFERALILSEDQPTELQIQLDPSASGGYCFQIFSRDNQSWMRHVSGCMENGEDLARTKFDPEKAANRFPTELSSSAFYQFLKDRHIHYDSPLQFIQTVRRGTGEAWAAIKDEDGSPRLLPLDPLFQLPLAALPDEQPGKPLEIFIPVSVDRISIFQTDQPSHWVYTQVTANNGHLIQDVSLLDKQGLVTAELHGIHFQLFGQSAGQEAKDFLYRLDWQPVNVPAALTESPRTGNWLILADEHGTGSKLAESLTRAGHHCEILLSSNIDQMEAWIREQASKFEGSLKGILHLWSLDIPSYSNAQNLMQGFEDAQKLSALSALRLVKVVATDSWSNAPRLWFVTQGAFLNGQPDLPPPDQASLWGLGRVTAEEHSNLWGGLIYLDDALSVEEKADRLAVELLNPTETQLAIDAQQRYALRAAHATFDPSEECESKQAFHLHFDSAYLITGGIGGIGIEVAKWMIQQGARRLILMGRRPLPERKDWLTVDPESENGRRIAAVRELEALGAAIHVAAVDVADKDQLSAYLQAYQQEGWPAIHGVMHTAGVVRDRLIIQTDEDDWNEVLRPKVQGTMLLHELLPNLDFFVLFSSIGAVLGPVGQGSYAAANAFLDSFASYRRAMGQPGVSINWGFWRDTGLQNSTGAQLTLQGYEKRGFSTFRASQGITALEIVLKNELPHAIVMPVEWEKFKVGLSQNHLNLFANLLAEKRTSQASSDSKEEEETVDIRAEAMALPYDQRKAYLEGCLKQQIAQVLKLSPARITPAKPLGALGLDSLMAIELRGKLEDAFKISLSATFVWSYPTLAQLTPYIAEKMDISFAPVDAPINEEQAATKHTVEAENIADAEKPAPASLDEADSSLDDLLSAIENLSDENIQQSFHNSSSLEDPHG